MAEDETNLEKYDDQNYRALIDVFNQEYSPYVAEAWWDERARVELSKIGHVIEEIEQEILRQTESLERYKQERASTSLQEQTLSRPDEEEMLSQRIDRARDYKTTLEQMAVKMMQAIQIQARRKEMVKPPDLSLKKFTKMLDPLLLEVRQREYEERLEKVEEALYADKENREYAGRKLDLWCEKSLKVFRGEEDDKNSIYVLSRDEKKLRERETVSVSSEDEKLAYLRRYRLYRRFTDEVLSLFVWLKFKCPQPYCVSDVEILSDEKVEQLLWLETELKELGAPKVVQLGKALHFEPSSDIISSSYVMMIWEDKVLLHDIKERIQEVKRKIGLDKLRKAHKIFLDKGILTKEELDKYLPLTDETVSTAEERPRGRRGSLEEEQEFVQKYIEACEDCNRIGSFPSSLPERRQLSDRTGLSALMVEKYLRESRILYDIEKALLEKNSQAKTDEKKEFWAGIWSEFNQFHRKVREAMRRHYEVPRDDRKIHGESQEDDPDNWDF